MIGQYAQGNEPVHQVAYLYSYAGAPYKTQARIREILPKLYTAKPDGLCGNDDCGQMSPGTSSARSGSIRSTPPPATMSSEARSSTKPPFIPTTALELIL